MEIEQTVNKRKKITRLLLILLMILLSLVCIKYLISKSKKYISENGKSSMGAVIDQIQQTYDLQVSGYYSQLQLVEEFLLHERGLSLETDVNKSLLGMSTRSFVPSVVIAFPFSWRNISVLSDSFCHASKNFLFLSSSIDLTPS